MAYRAGVDTAPASFLHPSGYARPATATVLREVTVVQEAWRWLRRDDPDQTAATGVDAPAVIVVPGFLAGDLAMSALAGALRGAGLRTVAAGIRLHVGCPVDAGARVEARAAELADRTGGPIALVGHDLGGIVARALATRRPDLVARLVTLGSPVLAPGAHHPALTAGLELLGRLHAAGVPWVMSHDCVAGACAETVLAECRRELAPDVRYTAVYSRRDGLVDWRACRDPQAQMVQLPVSHTGMLLDPRIAGVVIDALTTA